MDLRNCKCDCGSIRANRAGIDNPDARKYWEGYNSYFFGAILQT